MIRSVSRPPETSAGASTSDPFIRVLEALIESRGAAPSAVPAWNDPPVSVLVPAVSAALGAALCAGLERMTAAAGGCGVGVLDRKPAAQEVLLVVDLSAFKVTEAHGVHDDLDPVGFEDL